MTETTDSNALYRAFVACLVVTSLPIKNLAYIAPAIYLLILWLHGEKRIFFRVVQLAVAILAISSIALLYDQLNGRTVNFPGVWLGLLTYAPLLILLCERFNRSIDQGTYDRFINACVWFISFQSLIGVLQFITTRNPDAVCGTFGLLDGFQDRITIAQVYFTFTLFGMILFLIPAASQWKPRAAIAMGALTCILAQSGHQTIFFIVALIGCGVSRISHVGALVRTLGAAAGLTWLLLQFYPNTIWLAHEWFEKVTDTANSPKRLVCEGAVAIMDNPKNILIGTGLGQYSSRAALISADEYLTVKLPSFITGRSDYFNDYIRPSLTLFEEFGEGSAISKPYMSVISLIVELGSVAFIILAALICQSMVRCNRLMASKNEQASWMGFAMTVGIVFFVLCCFVENYAEFSQAIFAPFILFVVAGSRAQTLLSGVEARNRKTRFQAAYFLAAPQLH
jgi:hypothetical protein